MTPTEIYEDMLTRCWEVDTLSRESAEPDATSAAVGCLMFAPTGHMLAVEFGIEAEGRAFATIRAFGTQGEPLEPIVLHLDGAVMAVTPG